MQGGVAQNEDYLRMRERRSSHHQIGASLIDKNSDRGKEPSEYNKNFKLPTYEDHLT